MSYNVKYVCLFTFTVSRFHLETISLYVINCPQASKALSVTTLATMHTNDLSEKKKECLWKNLHMPKAVFKGNVVLMLYT